MSLASEPFALEEIVTRNAIDARWFLPFTIHRLVPQSANRSAVLALSLLDILDKPQGVRLQLTWLPESATLNIPPVQEHIITEWAACGVACAVIPLYTGLQVLQVAQSGDGFDYWIGDEDQEYGLEVSGTMGTGIEQRHRAKVKQLRQSPHKVAGYISITSFRAMNSVLSFHQQQAEIDE
jgi:hypothetical protein